MGSNGYTLDFKFSMYIKRATKIVLRKVTVNAKHYIFRMVVVEQRVACRGFVFPNILVFSVQTKFQIPEW